VGLRAPPIKIMTPPALVARELGAHIARSAASTPARDARDVPPTPPSEVMVAVAVSKAEQQRLLQLQHQQYVQKHAPPAAGMSLMDDGPSPRARSPPPAPLSLQLHAAQTSTSAHHTAQQLQSVERAAFGNLSGSLLHSTDDHSVGHANTAYTATNNNTTNNTTNNTNNAASGSVGSPPTSGNGYSLGASLPAGVQWRYVDVLNKQT